jgi:uncharacterized protein
MSDANLLAHKSIFDEYVSRSERPLSCYHFSSIFAWQDFFLFDFDIIGGLLCVFARSNDMQKPFLYLPPLGGPLKAPVLEACFRRMKSGTVNRLARVENICDNQLLQLEQGSYNSHIKAQEYIYLRADLEALQGQGYKSKRHDLRVFSRDFPGADFRPYTPADAKRCGGIYDGWAENRRKHFLDPVYLTMLEENRPVHRLLLDFYQELGLVGRVVEIDGEICGYTFGYTLDQNTFCVLLEVTDLTKKGLAAFIFNRFCADPAVKGFRFINAMDDFGMPQVAQTKLAYRPIEKRPVYTLKEPA